MTLPVFAHSFALTFSKIEMKSGLDKPSIQRDRDGVSAIIRSELRENALHVPFNSSLGNRELFRDELV